MTEWRAVRVPDAASKVNWAALEAKVLHWRWNAPVKFKEISRPSHTPDTANKRTPEEMWSILVDIQENVSKILTENQAVRREVEELKSPLESSNMQIANLKQLIEGSSATFWAHKKHLKDHREYVERLEDKLYDLELQQDSLEQYTRKYNIEIHGVPESKDENLHELITSVESKLDGNIQRRDFDIIHRLHRKPPGIKPIIVRFTTHGKKQEL